MQALSSLMKKKERDITASILKLLLKSNSINLDAFSDFHNLQLQLIYLSFFLYYGKWTIFEKGNIIPDNDFPETQTAFNKNRSLRKGFEIVKNFNSSNDLFSQSKQIKMSLNMKLI